MPQHVPSIQTAQHVQPARSAPPPPLSSGRAPPPHRCCCGGYCRMKQAVLIEQASRGKKASSTKVLEALRWLTFYKVGEDLVDLLLNREGSPPLLPPGFVVGVGCSPHIDSPPPRASFDSAGEPQSGLHDLLPSVLHSTPPPLGERGRGEARALFSISACSCSCMGDN